MDSAIPSHLQCPRLRQRRIEGDYVPPFPATVARFDPGLQQVVMAYLGIQFRADAQPAEVTQALHCLGASLGGQDGPGHWERAKYVDEAGYTNIVSIAYWADPARHDEWFTRNGSQWASEGGFGGGSIGTYAEILRPRIERFETLFSSNTLEGVGQLTSTMSDHIQEHGYWGSARDRFALSQVQSMAPSGEPRIMNDGRYQRVLPQHNLCLIRSGQDWSETEGEERDMYLKDVEPVLRTGMNFLRDEGLKIDCFANRYMTVLDEAGQPLDKRFGMSWWRCLAALERWAESHPTHVAIFGAAMKYLGKLGPAARLKLYHEVSVAAADEQYFEYFNCHQRTGMLRAVT